MYYYTFSQCLYQDLVGTLTLLLLIAPLLAFLIFKKWKN